MTSTQDQHPAELAALTCSLLSKDECDDIVEILKRRANDVASFQDDVKKWTGGNFREFPGSVEMALTRECNRLRDLAERVIEAGKANRISESHEKD